MYAEAREIKRERKKNVLIHFQLKIPVKIYEKNKGSGIVVLLYEGFRIYYSLEG